MKKNETKGWASGPHGFSLNWNFICCFGALGLIVGNFTNTVNSKLIQKLNYSIHIYIHQIVKEARKHHRMASTLLTSFSCTKDAKDKHNVPAWQKRVFAMSDVHLSQT